MKPRWVVQELDPDGGRERPNRDARERRVGNSGPGDRPGGRPQGGRGGRGAEPAEKRLDNVDNEWRTFDEVKRKLADEKKSDEEVEAYWNSMMKRVDFIKADKGKGKGKDDPVPDKLYGTMWEAPRSECRLKLVGDLQPPEEQNRWRYVMKDESRRSFAAHLPGFLTTEECQKFFETIRDETPWKQPEGPMGPIPRKTAWMVKEGCACTYRYGSIEVDPLPYPPWMIELMNRIMPSCGLAQRQHWPDSCNVNLYEDGSMSVGWHSDDERIFQGKFRDIIIISLSLGVTRSFELRLNNPETGERAVSRVSLGNGDLMTMEGMLQKHMQHRVPKEPVSGPRINLTWRWVVRHNTNCPQQRQRAGGSNQPPHLADMKAVAINHTNRLISTRPKESEEGKLSASESMARAQAAARALEERLSGAAQAQRPTSIIPTAETSLGAAPAASLPAALGALQGQGLTPRAWIGGLGTQPAPLNLSAMMTEGFAAASPLSVGDFQAGIGGVAKPMLRPSLLPGVGLGPQLLQDNASCAAAALGFNLQSNGCPVNCGASAPSFQDPSSPMNPCMLSMMMAQQNPMMGLSLGVDR